MFPIATEKKYGPGEIIIQERDTSAMVCIVRSGSVELSKAIKGKTFIVGIVKEGEVFGELGILGPVRQPVTARAVNETTIGVIDRMFLGRDIKDLSKETRALIGTIIGRYIDLTNKIYQFSKSKKHNGLKTVSLTYQDTDSFIRAYTDEVKNGGLFIRTKEPLGLGEVFLLRLGLPGVSNPLKIRCEVALTRKHEEGPSHLPSGMLVRFLEMPERDDQIFQRYIGDVVKGEALRGTL